MYDKTSTPPKAGSLREALFLHVWLKRQDIEVAKMRVIAQGIANREHLPKTFQEFINAVFPFAKEVTADTDAKMKAAIAKEIEKGAITFTPIEHNVLRDATKKYHMDAESLQKIRDAQAKRTGRKVEP